MFLKNKNIIFKTRRSKVTDYAALNAFYWYQIFALDSAVVEVQEMFSSHGGHLTNAMYHHGKHSNQINTP